MQTEQGLKHFESCVRAFPMCTIRTGGLSKQLDYLGSEDSRAVLVLPRLSGDSREGNKDSVSINQKAELVR